MTDFDKRLIEKAYNVSRWEYQILYVMIQIADTDEAREILSGIRADLIGLYEETL